MPAPRAPREARSLRGTPLPAALVERIRDSAVGAIGGAPPGEGGKGPSGREAARRACEAAVRLTLSYVVAPAASDEEAAGEVARVVRALLGTAARTDRTDRTE